MSPPDHQDEHLNPMAAATPPPHDYSADWVAELQRLTTQSISLPAPARQAVLATIEAIEAEDGILPQPALQARDVLAQSAQHTRTSPHSLADTLLAALKPSHQRKASPRQAHAA